MPQSTLFLVHWELLSMINFVSGLSGITINNFPFIKYMYELILRNLISEIRMNYYGIPYMIWVRIIKKFRNEIVRILWNFIDETYMFHSSYKIHTWIRYESYTKMYVFSHLIHACLILRDSSMGNNLATKV